jgi:putative membrane protein
MVANIRPFILIVLIAIAMIFAIQNVAEVEVQFLLWSVALPRAIMILVVLAVGMLIGWILHSVHIRRQKSRNESPGRRDIQA